MSFHGQCTLEGAWSVSNATCPYASDGSLCCDTLYSLVPGQGLPPYQCQIISPTGSYMYNTVTNCFENLSPNTYTIQTTSSDGCIGYGIYTVSTQYSEIVAPTTNNTPATCGGNNGSVCVNVSGGSGNYALAWIGPLPSTTLIATNVSCISNLAPGIYQLNVDDLAPNGCDRFFTKIIGQTNLTLSDSLTNTTCPSPNCNGSIDLTASGTAPYTYSWAGPGGFTATTEDLAGLCPGTYTVSVTDANGCTGTGSYTITTVGADVITGGIDNFANVISGNITWNPAYFGGQTTIIVDADVIVNPNAVLTINNLTVLVTPGHSIEGLVTSKIFGNNSIFDAICGDTWRGFEIHGGGINNEINRSELELQNCQVWHAECGIRNHNQYGTTYLANSNNFGGRITCDQTRFIDNVYDLVIANYYPLVSNLINYSSRFTHCEFRLNLLPSMREQNPCDRLIVGSTSAARINMLTTSSNSFHNCRIINSNATYNDWYRTQAILGKGAYFVWTGTDVGNAWSIANYSSQIIGWRIGITALNRLNQCTEPSLLSIGLEVNNTLFETHHGIEIDGSLPTMITNNYIRNFQTANFNHSNYSSVSAAPCPNIGSTYSGNGVFQPWTGIYVKNFENTSLDPISFFIAHNRFQDVQSNVTSYGISINGTGTLNNYIVSNRFEQCTEALRVFGINRNGIGENDGGLRYECNTFVDCRYDTRIMGNAATPFNNRGVATKQRQTFETPANPDLTYSAGNNFNNSVDALANDNGITSGTNSTPALTYCYHNAEVANDLDPELTHGSQTAVNANIIENTSCPIYDWRNYTIDLTILQNNLNVLRETLAAKKLQLTLLIDEGQTNMVLAEVEMATYNEAYSLYLELLEKSPALSDEVIIATIQKEYELPKSLLASLLAANPNVAKSDELQKALDDRIDPLDAYQRNVINSGKEWFSHRELKEMEIDQLQCEIDKILFQMQLTGISAQDLINFLDPTEYNQLIMQANLELALGHIDLAKNHIQNASLFKNSEINVSSLGTWQSIMEIRNRVQKEGGQLTTEEINVLESIWNTNADNYGYLAYLQLITYADYEPLEAPEIEELRVEEAQKNGIYFSEKLEILIWPNPAQEIITIEVPLHLDVITPIVILDPIGRIVLEKTMAPGQQQVTIPIETMPNGVYRVVVVTYDRENLNLTKEFIKE
jgi:hypothetical protein